MRSSPSRATKSTGTPAPPSRVRKPLGKRLRGAALPYGFLLPAFALVVVLVAYPLYVVLNLSFREDPPLYFSEIGDAALTLGNYAEVLAQAETWQNLWLSVVYTVGATAPAFLIGLGTALLFNCRFPGRRWFRTLALLPWAIPNIVAAIAFLWMFDASYGVVNYLLRSLGLISDNVAWFFNPSTAMFAVILPTIWKAYPFFTLVFLATLQSIPADLYEAARVDGASRWSQFRFVTWPAIQNSAILGSVLTGLWVFREFEIIYPITRGGPNGATQTLGIRIYNEAFRFFDLGTAATLGVITLVIAAAVVLVFLPKMRQSFF